MDYIKLRPPLASLNQVWATGWLWAKQPSENFSKFHCSC